LFIRSNHGTTQEGFSDIILLDEEAIRLVESFLLYLPHPLQSRCQAFLESTGSFPTSVTPPVPFEPGTIILNQELPQDVLFSQLGVRSAETHPYQGARMLWGQEAQRNFNTFSRGPLNSLDFQECSPRSSGSPVDNAKVLG
jgi:hypothetical protein